MLILSLVCEFEVFGDLRVLSFELIKFSICHGRVKPILPKLGQHVASWDLPLVLSHFRLLGDLSRLSYFLGLIDSFFGVERDSTVVEKEGQNFHLVLFLGPVSRSHALLVLHLQIGSLIDEEFDHLESVGLDSIVDCPLVFSVGNVQLGAQVDQVLHYPDMTLPDGVVNGRLAILILSVEPIWAALLDKVAHHIEMAFPRGIEKRDLLE